MAPLDGHGRVRLKAVVLAAGQARRFGGSKLTALYRGRPIMASALDVALQAPVDAVVLVTGAHASAVEAYARESAPQAIATGRLRLHHADRAGEGMGASLRAGVEAAMPADAIFVFLADMPAVPSTMAPLLAARLTPDVDAVAPCWRGRRGHPVLFGPALLPRLALHSADEGARGLLAELGVRVALVEAPDDGVLLDIDTVDDLNRTGTPPLE